MKWSLIRHKPFENYLDQSRENKYFGRHLSPLSSQSTPSIDNFILYWQLVQPNMSGATDPAFNVAQNNFLCDFFAK